MRLPQALLLLATCMLFTGCVTVPPYDYSALENSMPRSILVIPPINNSVEVNASYTFLSTISRPLAERGYYVFPVAVVDTFLKENGLPTPNEMHEVSQQKLFENIGADAVLYVTINDWGQKYQILSSNTVVHANARLIDARTGVLLWHTKIEAVQSSGDAGAGLAGALVSAIAQQIVGNVSDLTIGLSLLASTQALNQPQNGLLAGPYLEEETVGTK